LNFTKFLVSGGAMICL